MIQRAALFLALLLASVAACADSEEPSETPTPQSAQKAAVESSPGADETATLTPEGDLAEVIRVLDGDTIEVTIGGNEDTVRYIGVDSPESGACFSTEAQGANTELVAGRTVLLERDPDGERDRYDRLLRYVYVDDVFVNEELVRLGFAEATTRFPERAHREQLVAAEREAFNAGRGVWAACPDFGEPPPQRPIISGVGGILPASSGDSKAAI